MTDNMHSSTIHLLRSRELGSSCNEKNSAIYFQRKIQRILIKTRAIAQNTASEPKFESLEKLNGVQKASTDDKNRNTYSKWTVFGSETNEKLSMIFLDTKFMLRVPLREKTEYKMFCFLPSNSRRLNLQYTFSDTETKQWETSAIWYPIDNPDDKLLKQKYAITLMTLNKAKSSTLQKSQKIRLYDFNNGKLIKEVPIISDGATYKTLQVYHTEKLVICDSTKSSLKKDVAGEFLIFSNPPFELKCHLQVKKSAVNKNVYEIEIIGDFYTMKSKSMIEISSFDQVMTMAVPSEEVQSSFVLQSKPVVLWKMNTDGGYLDLQENVTPPLFITRNKYRFIATFQEAIEDDKEMLTVGEQNSIKFFPYEDFPTSPIKIVHGSLMTGYQIYALQPESTTHCLQKIFPKSVSTTEMTATEQSSKESSYERAARKNRKISYMDFTGDVHGIDYNGELELFAVVIIVNKKINITLYDSVTMDAFVELQPVKLRSKDRFSSDNCRQFIVNLQSTFLSIRYELDTDHKHRIYCLSFTDESQLTID